MSLIMNTSKQLLLVALVKSAAENPLGDLGFEWAKKPKTQPAVSQTDKRVIKKTPLMRESETLYKNLKDRFGIGQEWASKNILAPFAQQETRTRNIKQRGGGPGRGIYQFDNESLDTAINRYGTFINNPTNHLAQWRRNNPKSTAMDLSAQQQGLLTLANLAQHPKTDLEKARKTGNTYNLWLNGHHGPYDSWTQQARDRVRWFMNHR